MYASPRSLRATQSPFDCDPVLFAEVLPSMVGTKIFLLSKGALTMPIWTGLCLLPVQSNATMSPAWTVFGSTTKVFFLAQSHIAETEAELRILPWLLDC